MTIAVLADDVGLDSEIGAGGEGLSGGQRRRLAVARAYLRRPALLLLDEPTEGLDRDTARALLNNLRSALPRTTIVAAIHDRMLDHLPGPAAATVRLAAGRVVRLTGGGTELEPVGPSLAPPKLMAPTARRAGAPAVRSQSLERSREWTSHEPRARSGQLPAHKECS